MNKDVLYILSMAVLFLGFTAIFLVFLPNLNTGFLVPFSFITAYLSDKLVTRIIYGPTNKA
ncbi:hypothetical protein EF384_04845 [Aerococcus agrisoli]|uniref:Uncharacterized protein n=1 Tax=Aerococcus agrisoli TaxID=2487350 RepID=A0A3N4GEE8_9LACT|nr:hypothetical protein [Aerococcus agrisoli]RPA60585.1 hypothetical protein EF384_04845 [Aerococcus agrisoli]